MYKYNHIKALFFLGVISLLLLHQIVAHSHDHHVIEHSHDTIAHSESHSHHHDVPEKESSKKGLLDLFLEMHIHSVVATELLVTQESSVKELNVKKDVKTAISANNYSISINYDEAEKFTLYHPPNIHFNQYLSSLSLRGPPTLG